MPGVSSYFLVYYLMIVAFFTNKLDDTLFFDSRYFFCEQTVRLFQGRMIADDGLRR